MQLVRPTRTPSQPSREEETQLRYKSFMSTLHRIRATSQASIHENHKNNNVGLQLPPLRPTLVEEIDNDQVHFWSNLAELGKWKLPDIVRLLRGQTSSDPRPNKDLYEISPPANPALVPIVDKWNDIVRHGVRPEWINGSTPIQTTRPRNHSGIQRLSKQIRRHLRTGQLEGRYLIVDARLIDQWTEVFVSPLGAVTKTGSAASDIRPINDYSIPLGASVNDYTIRDGFPSISYNPPRDIAKRIHRLTSSHIGERVLMMLGDVSGAFRHIPINADSVHMFTFVFENLLVIDLSCGFGWCGSPAFYSLAGSIINSLYEHDSQLSRRFTGNVWCDDHTCIEVDTGSKCFDANLSLRRAMATVLGPTAINEQKFTVWSTECKALGLLWDTTTATVSIPAEKLAKSSTRVQSLLSDGIASRTALLKVIGSLRHVASCFPPARAFLQCLQEAASGCPKHGQHPLSSSTIEDLRWFHAILFHPARFNAIPVIHFAEVSEPTFHVFMDASGDGLCTLEPTLKTYIRQRFSDHDRQHDSINVRELRSAVLAALHWGPYWEATSTTTRAHVQFHIDNTSAVAWANRRTSRNPIAKMYNRLLSLAEFQYNLVFTAAHIAGKLNVMADAGSRVWTTDHPLAGVWTNMSSSWTQTRLEEPLDNLSTVWDQCSADTPWQTLPRPRTTDTGISGADSPNKWGGQDG